MNALSFFGYAITLSIASVVALIATRWIRSAWYADKALRVLSRERRTGETLYDTSEALSGDAHNWRGMISPKSDLPMTEISYRQTEGRINRNGQTCFMIGEVGCGKTPVDIEQTVVRAALFGLSPSNIAERRNLESRLVAPQPPPQNESGPALWPMIIRELGESEMDRLVATDMLSRHEFGVAKYGVPLVASNGRDPLVDAYQEALDGVVYLRAAFDDEASVRHEQHKLCVLGVVPGMTMIRSRVHQTYIDMLDLAKEIRELIRERDGR